MNHERNLRLFMFSVAVEVVDDHATFTVACDRCGVDLDVEGTNLPALKLRGFDELALRDPGRYEELVRRLRAASLSVRPSIIDAEIDIPPTIRWLGVQLAEHAKACKGTKP